MEHTLDHKLDKITHIGAHIRYTLDKTALIEVHIRQNYCNWSTH